LRDVNPPDTVLVQNLVVVPSSDAVNLAWDESPRHSPKTILPFTGYLILSGESPDAMQEVGTIRTPRYSVIIPQLTPFFAVYAIYAGRDADGRSPRVATRDAQVLLDFEQGDYRLESYSAEEDIDTSAWAITDSEAYPPSQHSLVLTANTWKKMAFARTQISDSTVWSIAVLSTEGDTTASLTGVRSRRWRA